MQVMGQVARETGFDALFLSALCDPEQGLAVGCKVLRKKFDAMAGDTTRALLSWNGGANTAYAGASPGPPRALFVAAVHDLFVVAQRAAQKQPLAAAARRQHARDIQRAQPPASPAAKKRPIGTPAKSGGELPSQIPLPSPIVLHPTPASQNPPPPQTAAAIPAEDLK